MVLPRIEQQPTQAQLEHAPVELGRAADPVQGSTLAKPTKRCGSAATAAATRSFAADWPPVAGRTGHNTARPMSRAAIWSTSRGRSSE